MKILTIKRATKVKDLSFYKKEVIRKIARDQFEKLFRLGLLPPILTR